MTEHIADPLSLRVMDHWMTYHADGGRRRKSRVHHERAVRTNDERCSPQRRSYSTFITRNTCTRGASPVHTFS